MRVYLQRESNTYENVILNLMMTKGKKINKEIKNVFGNKH